MPKVIFKIKSRLIDWLFENHWYVYDEYLEGWTIDYSGVSDYQHFREWLKDNYPELLDEWRKSA